METLAKVLIKLKECESLPTQGCYSYAMIVCVKIGELDLCMRDAWCCVVDKILLQPYYFELCVPQAFVMFYCNDLRTNLVFFSV